ncbi:potassium transporter TrkA [Pasteurellaceae bacterium LFhippo2]|nr:potassium transporter TrkA [Pasteurellaceae bacterium LFhippo2]
MQFAVIGLGRFGSTAAQELQALGNHITGIDVDEKEVEKVSENLNYSVILDSTDKKALQELNISDYDGVLVAIGENLEASLVTVINLIDLNVQNVWVKAKNEAHALMLEALGIEHIIRPEHDMGIRIAQAMNYPMIKQSIPLGNNHFLVKVLIEKNGFNINSLLGKYPKLQLVSIIRQEEIIRQFSSELSLLQADRLLIIGSLADLKSLAKDLQAVKK